MTKIIKTLLAIWMICQASRARRLDRRARRAGFLAFKKRNRVHRWRGQ